MNLNEIDGYIRFENIKKIQNATIQITEEWAEILECYMNVSKDISLADVYQSYRRIKFKVVKEITNQKAEYLRLMKRSTIILLEVWKYKDLLFKIINEVNEKFEPIMGQYNKIVTEIFNNTEYKIINNKVDTMILLFESELKIEYKGSLQKELSDVYKQTVNTLINTIEVKDSYTRGHSERVSIMAEMFGKQLNLASENLNELIVSAKLHDVGKIIVPENILTKKGKLTKEEYDEVKKHTEFGELIVKGIPGFERIAETIKYHHERYDGHGYYNLPAEKIPDNVYIICLCDTFDTMNSNRSYRSALSFDAIIDEYKRCSTSQFEPKLCNKFIDFLIDNFKDIEKIY